MKQGKQGEREHTIAYCRYSQNSLMKFLIFLAGGFAF
jgi:hypothetical protein